jgi:hypothetical protein
MLLPSTISVWEEQDHAPMESLKPAVFLEGALVKARKSLRIFGVTP